MTTPAAPSSEAVEDQIHALESVVQNLRELQYVVRTQPQFANADPKSAVDMEAKCLIGIGDLKVALALRAEDRGADARAAQLLDEAEDCFQLSLLQYKEVYAAVGIAEAYKHLGRIKMHQDHCLTAEGYFRKALKIEEELRDHVAAAESVALVAEAANRANRRTLVSERMRMTMVTHESTRARLRAVFDKYDRDKSGFMNVADLAGFSDDMGTSPSLTEQELAQLAAQLGRADRVSFEELWTWWMRDVIERCLGPEPL